MDKKLKFSDQPIAAKITYSAVIAILAITAIVVGMVSSSQKNKDNTPTDENPPITDQTPAVTIKASKLRPKMKKSPSPKSLRHLYSLPLFEVAL
jgi:hypothetical protein